MTEEDIQRWTLPDERSLPGISDWLAEFDRNPNIREAFATIFRTGVRRGIDLQRGLMKK